MTRWEAWVKKYTESEYHRRDFICRVYQNCEDCPVYRPCQVDQTEEDFRRCSEAFERKIDEYLDEEIEEG